MTPGIRPLIAGNWKMHGARDSLGELKAIGEGFSPAAGAGADGLVCVPATLLERAVGVLDATHVTARIAIRSQVAPIPAILRPKCWRIAAPPM